MSNASVNQHSTTTKAPLSTLFVSQLQPKVKRCKSVNVRHRQRRLALCTLSFLLNAPLHSEINPSGAWVRFRFVSHKKFNFMSSFICPLPTLSAQFAAVGRGVESRVL